VLVITTFSTYLSRIIIVKIYAKIYRYVNNTLRREVPYPLTVHSGVVDLAFHTKTNLYNTVIENILLKDLKELVDKVKKRKEKTGRGRKTTNSICDNYFFGDKTCSEVAKDLGISYHAVNEQINNISAEIADMLNHNEYCGYYITPSSKINKRYKITKKDSKYDSAHISKFRKKICSNCNKENILDRKSVLSNVMVCRYCNMPTAV